MRLISIQQTIMKQNKSKSWSNLNKILFRFGFSYIALYIILVNNGAYPFWYYLMGWLTDIMHSFIPWIGENVLNLPYKITTFTNGSGDTTYDYVIILCIFIISILSTLIWTVLDRKRIQYNTLLYWIRVAVRFYVGLMLIGYGLVKVIKLQFSDPSFYRLIQPYGESSPMGLAWTFLGFSDGYNLFMGIAEVAAVLLLFRKTVTFGAIITLMTTANVMAVNYFYDVPVKIISTHLVLLTLFLLSKDIKQLYLFFVKNQTTKLSLLNKPTFKQNWLNTGGIVIKVLVLFYALGFGSYNVIQSKNRYGSNAPKHKLYGLYEVESFVSNTDTIPKILDHDKRWRYIRLEYPGYFQVSKMNNERLTFNSDVDTIKHIIKLTSLKDSTAIYNATYKKTDSTMIISTIIKNDTISLKTKRLDKSDFLLTNRGFNWINERPFNR